MTRKRQGIALLVTTVMASVLFTGVALAYPAGGPANTDDMGSTAGPAMMQPGTVEQGLMEPGMGTPAGMGMGTGAGMGGQTGMANGAAHRFGDVMSGDWFAEYAENMASHGFMRGFDNGTFGPHMPITRGHFAAILGRMMNLQPLQGTTFSDTRGYWAAGMIEAMAHLGIIAGYKDGTFGPHGLITREQMAAFMDRAWKAMHGHWAPAHTIDAVKRLRASVHDTSHTWAETHIAHMMKLGVFVGNNGMFRPTETATRAHAAAVMWRWFVAGQSL